MRVPHSVENLERYLRRKARELALIESFIPDAAPGPGPKDVGEVIGRKFRAAASLKAAQVQSAWQLTETHWAERPCFHIGSFSVAYHYQRADLAIHGPGIYSALQGRRDIVWSAYTSCGMAAIASAAAAYAQIRPGGSLLLSPHAYPETRELIGLYGRRFGLIPPLQQDNGRRDRANRRAGYALFIDSGTGPSGALLRPTAFPDADLVLLDTTCFAASSGRVGAILRAADEVGLPVALLRSHTKLDSLGIEYGRLGSIVVAVSHTASRRRRRMAEKLGAAAATAQRLLGGAALPEHLPPFATGVEWGVLSRVRIAHIIENNRRAAAALAARARADVEVQLYRHGLFFIMAFQARSDEEEAHRMARSLAEHLRAARLPMRHTGSFGFDFAVTDAYPAGEDGHFALRVGLADFPAELMAEIVDGIGAWIEAEPFPRSRKPSLRCSEPATPCPDESVARRSPAEGRRNS